jgi:cytochrome c2
MTGRRYRFGLVAALDAIALVAAACGSSDNNKNSAAPSSTSSSTSTVARTDSSELRSAMRKVWADHMQWTYATVDAFFHDQKALDPTLQRLLANQDDIGNAIKPFYGDAAGAQLTALLRTHINEAVPVLKAAQAGDQAALKKAQDDWYANAQQIADFLTKANPDNWPASATGPALKMHIDQTTTYAVDLLKGDYPAAIADYGKAFDHMMGLADILTNGIAKQFPDKVSASAESAKTVELRSAMRKVWADHMQWTYATVDAFFHDPKALDPTLQRLLANQDDIGNAIKPFYGDAAGAQLTALLRTHINQAVPVLKAAQAGDDAALKKAQDDWYANAQQIADFLTKANPDSWPASATGPALKMHIDQTTTYSVDLLKGDYPTAIADYGKAFDHMMDLADILTNGIAKQFPDKVGN